MNALGFSRFPEWKGLYDAILPHILDGKTTFSYDELQALCGIDIRSGRGRAQFYRFRRELLKTHQMWMECISKNGYAIIASGDHPGAAFKRVGQARRKVGIAKAINTHVRIEDLSVEQRALQAATSAVLHEVGKAFVAAGKKFQLASQMKSLPVDLPRIVGSIEHKQ